MVVPRRLMMAGEFLCSFFSRWKVRPSSDSHILSPRNLTSQSGDDVWRPGGGVDRDNDDENGATNDDGWGTTANDNNDDADGKWLETPTWWCRSLVLTDVFTNFV
jgi:hypothetical protein